MNDPVVVAQFAWTERLCDRRGFRFEVWSGTDPVLLENLCFSAGHRRTPLIAEEFAPLVLEAVAAAPCTVADVERRLAGRTKAYKWVGAALTEIVEAFPS